MTAAKSANRHGIPEDTLLPRDTRRSVPIMLLRARDAVMARFRPILARHDLSEQQWRVMRILGEVDRLDAREVAERACVMAPSLTRIVRALEERGLVARGPHDCDGRRILLSITPAGIELISELTRDGRAVFAELESRYGAERFERLLDMLAELVALKP